MTTARKPEPVADEDWISLVEAARILGESRQTVLARAVKGELVAKHVAGRTVVSRQSVDRCMAASAGKR